MINMHITLSGTFMEKDTVVCRFKIVDDIPVEFEKIADKGCCCLPYELFVKYDGWHLVQFLKQNVVPPTRQGLDESLRAAGIDGYDISAILRYQNASNWENTFWVKFDGEGPQTWAALRKKIGYTN